MNISTILLLIWAVIGPIWAILFARKNPRISGWIAKEANVARAAAETRAEKAEAALKSYIENQKK